MTYNKTIIVLAALVVIVGLCLVVSNHYATREQLLAEFEAHQLLHAHHMAEQIQSLFSGHSTGLDNLHSFRFSQRDSLGEIAQVIQAYFRGGNLRDIRKVTIFDETGRPVYSTDSLKKDGGVGQEEFILWAKARENEGKIYVSSSIQDRNATHSPRVSGESSGGTGSQFVILMAFPLYQRATGGTSDPSGRRFIGVLSYEMNLQPFLAHELQDSKIFNNIWIVDQHENLLFQSKGLEVAHLNVNLREQICTQCHPFFDYAETILAKKDGIIRYRVGNGPEKMAGFAPVTFGNDRWIVVVSSQIERITLFTSRNLGKHIMLLGIVVLALTGASILIMRRFRQTARAEAKVKHWQEEVSERERAETALKQSRERLRFLSSQLLSAQETERRRISQELHDELGQALATFKLQVGRIQKGLPKEQEKLRLECVEMLLYIDQVIENVRRISRDMAPSVLEYFGLSATLKRMLNDFAKKHEIEVVQDMVDLDPFFRAEAQTILYRIFQEILNNTRKHSQATRFFASAIRQNGAVLFTVEDNGRGFDLNGVALRDIHRKGLGLDILNERVGMLGGELSLWSEEGKGTRITFHVPVSEEESS
jgi:signal transduction histidine kinase